MSYSASSINLFESCKHRYFRQKIIADVEDLGNAAADRGKAIHAQLEDAVNGTAPWPEEYPHVERWYNDRRKQYSSVRAELKFALDSDFEPCGFEDESVHVRGVVDLLLWNPITGSALIVDWKTGKKREGTASTLQMKLYALMVFLRSRKVSNVTTDLFWITTNEHTTRHWRRGSIGDLQGYINEAIGRIERETEFPPLKRQGGLCRGYCPVSDCIHYRKTSLDLDNTPAKRFW